MLFNIFAPLADDFGPLNVFRYLTFRTGGAVLTALLVSFIFGPMLIRLLRRKQGNGQPIRDDGPERHIVEKAGTPTMGGFLILFALTFSTLLWADITSAYVWVTLLVALGFGGVGFADDARHGLKPPALNDRTGHGNKVVGTHRVGEHLQVIGSQARDRLRVFRDREGGGVRIGVRAPDQSPGGGGSRGPGHDKQLNRASPSHVFVRRDELHLVSCALKCLSELASALQIVG